jgi:hypothetical protein
MEMNMAYYEATLDYFRKKQFSVDITEDTHAPNGDVVFHRKRAQCRLDDECAFIFEVLSYSTGRLDFYLELLKVGRVRSFSFPLDSWKFHPNRIEFKYRDDPETGLGLALTFDMAETRKVSS